MCLVQRVTDHLDAGVARLDANSTTAIAAFPALAADGRPTCLPHGARKELAVVLGVSAYKGSIATQLRIIRAPIHEAWYRRKQTKSIANSFVSQC